MPQRFVRAIEPIVAHGLREMNLPGATPEHTLRQVALIGALVGTGMPAQQAIREVERRERELIGTFPGEAQEPCHQEGWAGPGGMMPGGWGMPGGMMPGGMMPGGMMPGGMMPGGAGMPGGWGKPAGFGKMPGGFGKDKMPPFPMMPFGGMMPQPGGFPQ